MKCMRTNHVGECMNSMQNTILQTPNIAATENDYVICAKKVKSLT